ncbi:MAG: DNA replication/repair protein RecF [Gammaproteobacteria bacterium]
MQLRSVEIRDLRILKSVHLELRPGVNLLYGANGSGKTSVLEAVSFSASARSFRTPRSAELIRRQAPGFVVRAEAARDERGGSLRIEASRSRRGTRCAIGGKPVSGTSELTRQFPCIAITPQHHLLVDGSPRERRRFIDLTLFHVEQHYLDAWQCYHRALRQRNAAIRSARTAAALQPWEGALAEQAQRLDTMRTEALERLATQFEACATTLDLEDVAVHYRRGWDEGMDLLELLERSRREDLSVGHTRFGPHRADLQFTVLGAPAASIWSRGQAKLGAASLLLAQSALVQERRGEAPVLLIDDFGAELDELRRKKLAKLAHNSAAQIIVAVNDPTQWPAAEVPLGALFHVEQGQIVAA